MPLFWTHSEDSDFDEIRGATVCDAELQLADFELPDDAHRDGGLVGAIAVGPVRELGERALAAWRWRRWPGAVRSRARATSARR